MELYLGIYYAIGIIFGLERLSRVIKEDNSSLVCIGICGIILLWPLYIVYLLFKHNKDDRTEQ